LLWDKYLAKDKQQIEYGRLSEGMFIDSRQSKRWIIEDDRLQLAEPPGRAAPVSPTLLAGFSFVLPCIAVFG
jgi:hypothetical protein